MIAADLIEQVLALTSPVDVIGRHVELKKRGREYVGLCPFHNERTPSFCVSEAKAVFHCFGCGAHGDAIDFIRKVIGLSFHDAVMRLAIDAGLATCAGEAGRPRKQRLRRPSVTALDAERAKNIHWARGVWRDAHPASGTLVETYLRSRGITIATPPSLRYAPRLKHKDAGLFLPTMIGAVQAPDGTITGIHRTYLRADGQDKADVSSPKKMAGQCWGGAVRFAKAAAVLVLAEGIETALSVAEAVPELAVWAALSLGNIAGAGQGRGSPHPRSPGKILPDVEPNPERPGIVLPNVVSEVILAADSDNSDPESAEALLQRAVRRFNAQGRTVSVARAPQGFDFNDVLLWSDNVTSFPTKRTAT